MQKKQLPIAHQTDYRLQFIQKMQLLKNNLGLPTDGYTFFPAGGTNVHAMIYLTDANIFYIDIFDHNKDKKIGKRLDWTKTDSLGDYKTYERHGYNIIGIIYSRLKEASCTSICFNMSSDHTLFKFKDVYNRDRNLIYTQCDHTEEAQLNLPRLLENHNIPITSIFCKAVEPFLRSNEHFINLLTRLIDNKPKLIVDGTPLDSTIFDFKLEVNSIVPNLHKDYYLFCYDGVFNIINSISEPNIFNQALHLSYV